MIRLLALDLDGTVLDSHGQIPDANRTAIARAIDAGVEVAIATGRRYDFARPIFERLPAPLTLILSNGAIVKSHDGQTLMRRLLPRAAARAVLAGATEHRASAALIFDRPREGQVVFESIDWNDRRHRRFYEANRPFVSEQSPLEDALTEDPVQVMFTGGCAAMRRLFDGLREAASSLTLTAIRWRSPIRASRFLARRRPAGRLLQGGGALGLGGASGSAGERSHGGWRQPERSARCSSSPARRSSWETPSPR